MTQPDGVTPQGRRKIWTYVSIKETKHLMNNRFFGGNISEVKYRKPQPTLGHQSKEAQ